MQSPVISPLIASIGTPPRGRMSDALVSTSTSRHALIRNFAGYNKLLPQARIVLRHLVLTGPLTQLTAVLHTGAMHLPRRIMELREFLADSPYDIVREWDTSVPKRRTAVYSFVVRGALQ